MKTLVGIQGYAAAQETITLLCPYYVASGCDLVGFDYCRETVPCWPKCFKEVFTHYAKEETSDVSFHSNRLLECFKALWKWEHIHDYESIILTEQDSIFMNNPPSWNDGSDIMKACVAGYCPPEWGCGEGPFLHSPWRIHHDMIPRFWMATESLIEHGNFGNGSPDVYLGIIAKEAGCEVQNIPDVYSCNGLDMRCASKLQEARTAYNTGAWHIHGIKHREHLDYITGKTEQWPSDVIMQ